MNDEELRAKKDRAFRMKEWAKGENGLFAVFDAVEKNYLETLMRSDIEDANLREKVYHRVSALRDIRRAMETVVADGAAADAIIKKLSQANTGRRLKV